MRPLRVSLLGGWMRTACTVSVLAATVWGCRKAPITTLERLAEARRLSDTMLVQFTKAVDAGNRAVMADTDEASVAFVREAETATAAVGHDSDALGAVLRELDYADEAHLLDGFAERFAEFRTLDRSILELAVENTNLKAQRLSFGPMQEAADTFRDALQALGAAAKTGQMWHARALAAEAVAAVREMQVLQAAHIAESDEAAMTRLEKQAADSEAAARRSVETLAGLARPAAEVHLTDATVSLNRFAALNTQLTALSRRNSNVRSLALSLGQKRTLTAACEEDLHALQVALAQRGFSGTR